MGWERLERIRRRDLVVLLAGGSGLLFGAAAHAQPATCPSDGTPMQFVPKRPPDPAAADNDVEKYPSCPYCGMDRRKFHHARMLVVYGDDVPDPTCSLHCAAISLSINIDRGPKAIHVADAGTAGDLKPLIDAQRATFLVGSALPGVMTRRSKVAYGAEAAARAAQGAGGGELVDFERALVAAYADMAQDVAMIRKNRDERRRRMPAHSETRSVP